MLCIARTNYALAKCMSVRLSVRRRYHDQVADSDWCAVQSLLDITNIPASVHLFLSFLMVVHFLFPNCIMLRVATNRMDQL